MKNLNGEAETKPTSVKKISRTPKKTEGRQQRYLQEDYLDDKLIEYLSKRYGANYDQEDD